jgi:hypothetical protein
MPTARTSWRELSSLTTSTMVSSVAAGLVDGVARRNRSTTAPAASTTPARTFEPPMSTPTVRPWSTDG